MPTLFLCAGLQSSGSTLLSWCFLQRTDMNGVLDADNDLLPVLVPHAQRGMVWYKTTISCFRPTELIAHFQDYGWEVRPLLVVRDVRKIWASLMNKPYARNGLTAEDPPLRMRLRRFLMDWELFQQQNWPILCYEDFLDAPEKSLRQACAELKLAWDENMLRWPKQAKQIADAEHGNKTFWATRGNNLAETLARHVDHFDPASIARADWHWLEGEFRAFNVANNYPLAAPLPDTSKRAAGRALPSFEVTRRCDWEIKKRPLRRLLLALGIPNQSPGSRKTIKKVA
jgi:hypothetical protein